MTENQKTIEIVAPSRGGTAEDLSACIQFLESHNFKVKVALDLFGEDLLCSNTDEKRFAHLEAALLAPDTDIIWCFRGGYGSTRLLEDIQQIKKPKKQKLLVGFSDITALHLFVTQKWNWPALHAPVLAQVAKKQISEDSIKQVVDVVSGNQVKVWFEDLEPLNIAANKRAVIKSKITGGNLSLIQATLATDFAIKAKNKIVLLEDIDEPAYRLDRILTQIVQSGIFDKAAAIILADFIDIDTQVDVDKVTRRFAENIEIPVLRVRNIGHGSTNFPIPLNTYSELEFGETVNLSVFSKLV